MFERFRLPILSLAIAVVFVACSGNGPSHDQAVLATGSHCGDEREVPGCERATVVVEASQLSEALAAWGYESDAVSMTDKPLLFVGSYESSGCPDEVQDVAVTNFLVAIKVGWVAGGDCTSDANSRSFIIELDTTQPVLSVEINGIVRPFSAQ